MTTSGRDDDAAVPLTPAQVMSGAAAALGAMRGDLAALEQALLPQILARPRPAGQAGDGLWQTFQEMDRLAQNLAGLAVLLARAGQMMDDGLPRHDLGQIVAGEPLARLRGHFRPETADAAAEGGAPAGAVTLF